MGILEILMWCVIVYIVGFFLFAFLAIWRCARSKQIQESVAKAKADVADLIAIRLGILLGVLAVAVFWPLGVVLFPVQVAIKLAVKE